MMRRAVFVALLIALLAPPPANALTQLTVHAKRISLYSDRLALIADGDVRMWYPEGAELRADTLYVDLRSDRYLWVGHVHATFGGAPVDATALSVDRDGATAYALVADEGPPRVERYERYDAATRTVVAAPDGAFDLPPLREFRPFIFSSRATIVPKVNVRFTPAFFPTSAGITVPSPSYLYTFVGNPNFGATALTGGNFDQPYGLLGTERSLTAAHFRYDSLYGAGISITQQFVDGDDRYLALALGPLRKAGNSASLLAYSRIDSIRSQTLSASTTDGLQQALYRFTQGTRHGALALSLGQVNSRASGDVAWSSDPYPISRSGFAYRLRADYGFDHDPTGLLPQTADPTPYHTMWRTTLGTFVSSPTFWGPFGSRMNVTLDGSRTWYAYPHQRDALSIGSTISRRLTRQLNLVGQIAATFSGDNYPGRQLLFYPPPPGTFLTPDGSVWPGYTAFVGFASQRTYALTAYYTTIPPFVDLRVNVTAARDFPQFGGFGRPPLSAGFDLRYRPGNTLVIELGRSYAFQWANLGWSPQWTFSISQ